VSINARSTTRSTYRKVRSLTCFAKVDDSRSNEMATILVGSLGRVGTDAKLILASQSPRRKEILDMMGLSGKFAQIPSPLDEEALQTELASQTITPEDYARVLAERKAEALGMHLSKKEEKHTFIIGSDTIVDLEGHILNKPLDRSDAIEMLTRLSGNWHRVHTGVALYKLSPGGDGNEEEEVSLFASFTDTANVKFAKLSDEDIEAYVNTKEPMDKAGSYGIQGIGGQLVERMEGDFFTVMGLPMHRVSKVLAEAMAEIDE